MAGSVEYHNWQKLTRQSRAMLNPFFVTVGHAWHMRDFDKFCICFFWGVDQAAYIENALAATHGDPLTGVGSGATLEEAVEDVLRQVFKGL